MLLEFKHKTNVNYCTPVNFMVHIIEFYLSFAKKFKQIHKKMCMVMKNSDFLIVKFVKLHQ